MSKQIHYISGLPRSGSTLLCNILAQNPRFYASPTSGLPDLIVGIKNGWDTIASHRAMSHEKSREKEVNVLKAISQSYYEHRKEPVIFDKSRAWPNLIETLDYIQDSDVKVIVTVRDIREILASFELLHRKNTAMGQTGLARSFSAESMTIEGRMNILLRKDQPVGSAYTIMRDMLQRGWGNKNVYLVDFENLTTDPDTTMRMLYAFLNEEIFEHDFTNIKQVTQEDDRAHGILGLHTIRQKIEPIQSRWEDVLGEGARLHGGLNFWKHYK